jgi:hypothetical protein
VQDLDLSAVDACALAPVSIIGKHLCGGCTDLSMRANCHWHKVDGSRSGFCSLCDSSGATASQGGNDSECHQLLPASVSGMDAFIVATCCHHRLTWAVFAGQQHWLQLGFSRADFEVACRLSAWHNLWGAACARTSAGAECSSSAAEGREERAFDWMKNVGRAAKDIFDACR